MQQVPEAAWVSGTMTRSVQCQLALHSYSMSKGRECSPSTLLRRMYVHLTLLECLWTYVPAWANCELVMQ
jgi:hypothetical protein